MPDPLTTTIKVSTNTRAQLKLLRTTWRIPGRPPLSYNEIVSMALNSLKRERSQSLDVMLNDLLTGTTDVESNAR